MCLIRLERSRERSTLYMPERPGIVTVRILVAYHDKVMFPVSVMPPSASRPGIIDS